MSTNKIYFTNNISQYTKHVRFCLFLPISVIIFFFRGDSFVFLTLSPNIPIFFTAISQHTLISLTHCSGYITAQLKIFLNHFWYVFIILLRFSLSKQYIYLYGTSWGTKRCSG